MSCGVGCRHGSDVLLWLWRRLAATAPFRPLAWEPPYAAGAAPEKTKRQKKKKEREREKTERKAPCDDGHIRPMCLRAMEHTVYPQPQEAGKAREGPSPGSAHTLT